MAQTQYINLFASPLMMHTWEGVEALNAELRDRILEHRAKSQGVSRTNIGGWHSEFGKIEFCGAVGATLVERMIDMGHEATARVMKEHGHPPVQYEWALDAWANVNDQGDINCIHTHAGSTWSGAYYVDTGVDAGSAVAAAPMQIIDPCQGRANTFLPPQAAASFTLKPEPGMMVLFPSYLPHMVFPNTGSRPRISIAFNLRRQPFP